MTSPAPATGRTADENEMREALAAAALETLICWCVVVPGTTHTTEVVDAVADALLSGPLAPILQEAATLRARLQEAEKADDFWREVLESVATRWREAAMMAVGGDMRRLQRLLDAKPIVGSAALNPNQEAGDGA